MRLRIWDLSLELNRVISGSFQKFLQQLDQGFRF